MFMNDWAALQHLLCIIPNNKKGHPGYTAAFLMTPYGQHQLTAKIYGGVVDELTEEDTRAMRIPNAPLATQEKIGHLVVRAFELKDEASATEECAIRKVEEIIRSGWSDLVARRAGQVRSWGICSPPCIRAVDRV